MHKHQVFVQCDAAFDSSGWLVASPLLLSIKGGAADNILMFSIKGVTEEAIGFAVEGVPVTSLSFFEIAGRFPVAKSNFFFKELFQ